MSETTETSAGWLTDDDLEVARGRVPMVYVDAVPVRVSEIGEVTEIGLLLRPMADGTVSRALVTGRVHWGERIRHAGRALRGPLRSHRLRKRRCEGRGV